MLGRLRYLWLLLPGMAFFACAPTAIWAQTPTPTPNAFTCVNAANYSVSSITYHSIVAGFGTGLATTTVVAPPAANSQTPITLPTTLGGTTVKVAGIDAPLFFVSPTQINFVVPPTLTSSQLTNGRASVEVRAADGTRSVGFIEVRQFAPAIFTADSSGKGAPAGIVIRVTPNNQQSFTSLATYDAAQRIWQPQFLDLNVGTDRIFLSLFLTGIRNAADPNGDGNVNETVRVGVNGGIELIPQYAGKQPTLVGLDQINVEIPRSLYGAEELRLTIFRADALDGESGRALLTIPLRTPALPTMTWEARGLSGQSVNHLAASKLIVLAATNEGLFRTANQGRSWEEQKDIVISSANPPSIKNVRALIARSDAVPETEVPSPRFVAFTATPNPGSANLLYAYGGERFLPYPITPTLTNIRTLFSPPFSANVLAGTERGLYTQVSTLVPKFPPFPGLPTEFETRQEWVISPSGFETSHVLSLTNDLIGTAGTGLYVNNRLGRGWRQVTDGIATDAQVNKLAAVGQYAFAGVQGKGLYRSTNYGATWQLVNNVFPANDNISAIATYGNHVAAATFANGVYLSSDFGQTWRASNQGLGNLRVHALVFDEFRLMVGTENGIYLAGNFGYRDNPPEAKPLLLRTAEDTPLSFSLAQGVTPQANWQYLVNRSLIETLSGTAPNLTYTPPPNFNGTVSFSYRVTDGRVSTPWTNVTIEVTPVPDAPVLTLQATAPAHLNGHLTVQLGQSFNISVLGTTPKDESTPVISLTAMLSALPGSLTQESSLATFRGVAAQVGTYTLVFVAGSPSGGPTTSLPVTVTVTDNSERAAWTPLAPFSEPYDFGNVLPVGNVLLVSTTIRQSSNKAGVLRSQDGGKTWNFVSISGLSQYSGINALVQTSNNVVLAGTQRDGIFRSTDFGLTWTASNQGIDESPLHVHELAARGNRVLARFEYAVYSSLNGGMSWTKAPLTLFNPDGKLTLAVTDTHFFALGAGKGIYRSADNGQTWTLLQPTNIPNVPSTFSLQLVGTTQEQLIYNGAYRSTDQGNTWTPMPSAPPGVNTANALRGQFFLHSNDLYYAEAKAGTWVQRNSSGAWLPLNLGLPPYSTGFWRFATNGTQLFWLAMAGKENVLFQRSLTTP